MLETSLTAKEIVSNIFYLKNAVFLKDIYVIRHSRMCQIAQF